MLTIYAPFKNKNSKAWEVFDAVEKSWPDQVTKLDNTEETEPVSNIGEYVKIKYMQDF